MVDGDEVDQKTLSQGGYVNSALDRRQNKWQQYKQESMLQGISLKGCPANVAEIEGVNAGSPR